MKPEVTKQELLKTNLNLTFWIKHRGVGFSKGEDISYPSSQSFSPPPLAPGISFTRTHVTCFIILSSSILHIYPPIPSVSSPPPTSPFSVPPLWCMCLHVLLDRREYFATSARDGQLKSSVYSGKRSQLRIYILPPWTTLLITYCVGADSSHIFPVRPAQRWIFLFYIFLADRKVFQYNI